ncbi:MAG: hypothetical protein GY898_00575 [Proteobacteria bacterium]|nr:hypothetical protein [Pseudomonadota bacterium]
MRLLAPSILLTFLFLLTACGEGAALHVADTDKTVEAYQAFLAEYPDSSHSAEVQGKIEGLRYDAAKDSRNPEVLRDFLTHHPDHEAAGRLAKREDEVAWQVASAAKTAEGYKSYIDFHPEGTQLEAAQAEYALYAYAGELTIADIAIAKVNMAQDPEGPLNGWGITANVTNPGDKRLKRVTMAIDSLGASGDVVSTDTWYTVVQDLGPMPVPPPLQTILEPGETKGFRFTTAEAPEGWAEGSFALRAVSVRFAPPAPAPASDE